MSKPKTGTVTREKVEVRRRLLRSTPSSRLEPEEERALRMRHGIGLDPDAPLPSKAEGHPEAAKALLRMEAELLHAVRRASEVEVEEEEAREDEEQELRPRPMDSRIKSKIVRALRKKS